MFQFSRSDCPSVKSNVSENQGIGAKAEYLILPGRSGSSSVKINDILFLSHLYEGGINSRAKIYNISRKRGICDSVARASESNNHLRRGRCSLFGIMGNRMNIIIILGRIVGKTSGIY